MTQRVLSGTSTRTSTNRRKWNCRFCRWDKARATKPKSWFWKADLTEIGFYSKTAIWPLVVWSYWRGCRTLSMRWPSIPLIGCGWLACPVFSFPLVFCRMASRLPQRIPKDWKPIYLMFIKASGTKSMPRIRMILKNCFTLWLIFMLLFMKGKSLELLGGMWPMIGWFLIMNLPNYK